MGKLHRDAQRHAARNDRDFVQRIGARSHRGDQSVAGLVVRRVALFLVGQNHGPALDAHEHFVLGHFEIRHGDELAILARRPQRGFVHQIREIGAGKSRSAARDHGEIHVVRKRNFASVHAKNFFAALYVWTRHNHAAIETARAQKRRIENVRTVGGGDQDDAFVRFEAVHFDEQRVQGLLALVVSAAETCAAMAADRVDFIDEDDARRVLLALLEKIANAAGAHADEHLDEIRTGNREERNVRFAGNRASEQSLAGSRRPDEQHALRNASAELLEFLRILQEVDNFVELFLGLVNSSDVLERGLLLLRGEQARARLSEAERLVSAGLHLLHHENPERDEQHQRAKLTIKLSQSAFFTSL